MPIHRPYAQVKTTFLVAARRRCRRLFSNLIMPRARRTEMICVCVCGMMNGIVEIYMDEIQEMC